MKKIFSILAIALCFSVSKAQVSPSWPYGAAQGFTIATTGTTSIAVANNMVYNTAVPNLNGSNITINATFSKFIKAGAHLLLTVKTTSTETTTFGTGIIGPVVTGVAGKTWSQLFIYDGTILRPAGAKIQND